MSKECFYELLQLLLDDDISAAQMDELTEIVASDKELLIQLRQHLLISDRLSQYEDQLRSAERFMDALRVRIGAAGDSGRFVDQVVASVRDSSLGGDHQGSGRKSKGSRQFPRGFASWLPVAVALLFLVGILINHAIEVGRDATRPQFAGDDVAEPVDVNDSGVAVLTRVAGLQGTATTDWRVGETIPPGSMAWSAGLLQLEFYSGATVVVEGPAEIEILDESRVVCQSGRLRAHVPDLARGFAVLSPSFELVDLGTEFGLNVSDDGVTEVHVFDGKVELYDVESNRNLATRRELSAGDALTVERDGTSNQIAAQDADFVTPARLSQMTDARRQGQLQDWRAFRDSLRGDPRVVAYFPFDRSDVDDRLLIGYGASSSALTGAIVGCEWSEGRWPDKPSLQFKRPGDRVRIEIPGEFKSLTYSTWLRVDGLDRRYNSLLLTDGWDKYRPHWQVRQDGTLVLGIMSSQDVLHSYRTHSIFNLFRLGQWVHLATTYDADEVFVTHYVNGELATREPLMEPASRLLKIGKATIGNWSDPSVQHHASSVRNFNGCMDELIVFGEALDQEEVRRIFEVGRP